MKKLITLAVFALCLAAEAVGPRIPCYLVWTPQSDADGFWFYWRAVGGTYTDAQRIPIGTNQQNFDLRTLGLAQGIYIIMMTATNKAGAESDPSDNFTWVYQNPNKPTNVSVISSPRP